MLPPIIRLMSLIPFSFSSSSTTFMCLHKYCIGGRERASRGDCQMEKMNQQFLFKLFIRSFIHLFIICSRYCIFFEKFALERGMLKQCLLEPRCRHFEVFKTVYVHGFQL